MRKKILVSLLFFLVLSVFAGYTYYFKIFASNIVLQKPEEYLLIKTGSTAKDVLDSLTKNNWIVNGKNFIWLGEKMNYKNKVLAGRYKITNGMSNRDLILMLRSGKQEPVNFTFNNLRTKEDLVMRAVAQLEVDSVEFAYLLSDSSFIGKKGFTNENIVAMFLPNTYEMYWNTSAEKLMERMDREYKTFWNEARKLKAKEIGLTPVQVSVLASIVEAETKKNDEKPKVAGVYLNRLNHNWHLEADPTLIFALGDFTIKRVLNEYKLIDSPYNTYMYSGLPPGPICIPEISSIEAVLNFTHHDYMYFCARADLSGYHEFAKNYKDHLSNAKKYQAELNKRNIRS